MRPQPGRPVVVSILTINQERLLQDCLTSLFADPPRTPFLVHVFDQASKDGTRAVCEAFAAAHPDRFVAHHHHENVGFVHANNIVFDKYPGQDVVVLNDDTVLLPGWLDALVERAYSADDIGVVGARLVYPDGVLQEAGGEIFRDGFGQNVGKWDDPGRPSYLESKDVQYCSGALLYVRREALDACGGRFDPRLAPAYYEDTDLCFAARAAGWRVVYEPLSVIIHREGATNGVDTGSGVKRWQEVNRHYFTAKWARTLARHRRGMWEHPDAPRGRHVLVIHLMPPLHDQASGDRRLYEMLLALNAKHRVTFLAVDDRGLERYTEDLCRAGVHALANDVPRWPAYGREGGWRPRCASLEDVLAHNDFDLAILEFHHQARVYLPELRRLAPGLPVVVDSVDVHFLRERREAELYADELAMWRAGRTRRDELSVYERADAVLTVTAADRAALRAESPALDVRVVPNLHEVVDAPPPRDGRAGLVFVGGFRHPPNVDAALWLVRDILPLVRRELPDVRLTLAGSDPPPEVRALAGAGIEVTGYVPDIAALLDARLVSVAPLRYGAGMKGKIAEALGRGLPVVTTPCGAEGMDLEDGVHALIGTTEEALAAAIVRASTDAALWQRLADAGRAHVADRWSVPVVARQLDALATDPPVARPARASRRHRLEPDAPPAGPLPREALGVIVAGSSPESTAGLLRGLMTASGREIDAVVLVPEAALDDWDVHAAGVGFRIAGIPQGRSLDDVVDAVAAQLAGNDLLLAEDTLAVFRWTLDTLRAALEAAPCPAAVRARALPVAPVPGAPGDEPWDLAAARVRAESRCTEAAVADAPFVWIRRDRVQGSLVTALASAMAVPTACVVDPRRIPLAVEERARTESIVIVRVEPTPGRPLPPLDARFELADVAPGDVPLGARLAEIVAARAPRRLVVVDGHVALDPDHSDALVAQLEREGAAPALLLSCRWSGGTAELGTAPLLDRTLAADVPRALPLLRSVRPLLAFTAPSARLFEPALDGASALAEAVLRAGGARRPPGRHGFFRLAPANVPQERALLAFVERERERLAAANARVDRPEADARFVSLFRFACAGEEALDLLHGALELCQRESGEGGAWDGVGLGAEVAYALCQIAAASAVFPEIAALLPPARQQRHLGHSALDAAQWPREAAGAARAVLSAVRGSSGDPQLALAEARRSVTEAPRQRIAWFALAQAELRAGRVPAALEALARLRALVRERCRVEIFPSWPAVLRALVLEATLVLRAGAPADVIALVGELERLRLRPGGRFGARLLELKSAALAALGDARGAAAARLDALALFPNVADRPAASPQHAPAPESSPVPA